ncbi:LOW QUALITY PROTEIN: cdc42 effector protein 2 [Columba livia]|uniref:LOW QUALITY PROTEIN: cdc42 effector protein 2 n=1 Tax=Columba livia TaxID=8932 RepID=UPI0031BB582C
MSAKAPIYLKRGGRKGKKEKLRDLLSRDMISPPLGDFRHTIHVGGAGDTFGDVSFLQGKLHLLPRAREAPEPPAGVARTATLSGRPAVTAAPSPLLKNAVSLPVIAGPRALTLPHAPPKPPRLRLDEKTPPRDDGEDNSGHVAVFPEPFPEPLFAEPSRTAGAANGVTAPPTGSLLSLHVDLGPSILEDVLRVMDKHHETPT